MQKLVLGTAHQASLLEAIIDITQSLRSKDIWVVQGHPANRASLERVCLWLVRQPEGPCTDVAQHAVHAGHENQIGRAHV